MTKNEYLIELAVKIQALTDRPRAIDEELKAMISFYQEMIDDKMEDGMTEEEAVAAMEPIDEIIDRLKGEFTDTAAGEMRPAPAEAKHTERVDAQSANGSERMRREYAPGSLNKIMIEDSNSGIHIKPGNVIALNYCSNDEGHYEITESAGILVVKYIQNKRGLFRLFSFRRKRDALVLEVPVGWDGTLAAYTSNAKIDFEGEITDVLLRTSNAGIAVESVTADRIRAVTSNGKIYIGCGRCREAEFVTSNAKIDVNNLAASEALEMGTSNGSIVAANVVAPKFSAVTGNAGIHVHDIDSDDITLASSNGSISGTVRGCMADFAIISKTSNGRNNLPNGTAGGKKLDVRTSNGSISVDFAE